MNNYENVFTKIKELCTEENDFQSDECYQQIAEMLQARLSLSIHFYLESLSHLGLIIYHDDINRIILTPKGIDRALLFE